MKPDSNRLVAVDALVIALASAAICLASKALLFMTIFIPLLLLARMATVMALARSEGVNIGAELLFLLICTAFGAFNDWNSVCNNKIYLYTVPHYFKFSTIPIWMLLFWGMILRFVARLARWKALGAGEEVTNTIGVGKFKWQSGLVRVIFQLLLVFATRQAIYRNYMDPLWSWIPFLMALVLFFMVGQTNKHDLKLVGIFLLGGPLIEILYIQVGTLHYYHLGWLGGVPLWIALWWLLIVVIWKDLAFRIEHALRSWRWLSGGDK